MSISGPNEQDVVDRIDELVDEQMVGGEPRQGFDFGDPTYPKCPHCQRHWHGLPVTEQIARMYSRGVFDEGYRVDADDSPILCRGSDFIGPMPVSGVKTEIPQGDWRGWIDRIQRSLFGNILDEDLTITWRRVPVMTRDRWWRIVLPHDAIMTPNWEVNTVTIDTGSGWIQTFDNERVRVNYREDFDEVRLFGTNTPVRMSSRMVLDVLQEEPPNRLRSRVPDAYWRPLTASGVTNHPSDRHGVRVDPFPGLGEFTRAQE